MKRDMEIEKAEVERICCEQSRKEHQMKAWILHEAGTIKYEETDVSELKEHEVLIAVKAAGICGSDIPRIFRDGAHKMPLIPGHEFSGEVVQLGKWVDESWLHKRVGVYPLIPCRECIACQKEKYEMCRQYSYLGSRQDGGFAEYVAVPANNLSELPESVSYEQAAMLEPMSVAVHAMRRVEVAQTDIVVVYGLGTIGLLLIMFLLEKGIQNVYAIGNKTSQKAAVYKLGLPESHFCNCKENDVPEWFNSQSNGYGADVVFECVGRMEVLAQTISLATVGGRICVVGNPYTDMVLEKNAYWKILRNQLTIVGTWNSSFFKAASEYDEYGYIHEAVDWEYVLNKLAQNRIAPQELISHRFSSDDLEQGLHIMRDKTEDYIKIMMIQ